MKLKCTVFKRLLAFTRDTVVQRKRPLRLKSNPSTNRPFAACHSRGTKLPKVPLGQDQQKADIILNGNFLSLSCPSATFRPSMTVLYYENGKLQRAFFPSRKDYSSKGVLTRDQIRTCNWTILCLLNMYEIKRVGRDEIYC